MLESGQTTNEDDFDTGFADAIAGEKPAENLDPDPTPAAPVAPEPAAPVAPEPAAPVAPEPAAPVAPAAPVTPEPVAPEPAAARQIPPAAPTPAPVKSAPIDHAAPPAAEFPDPVLSAEDKALIETYEGEWPDVAAAHKKLVAHEMALVEAKFARALSAIVARVYGDMTPVVESYSAAEQTAFRKSVLDVHTDFDTILPSLKPWIDQQPGYLRAAMTRVYDEGTAEEVIDLARRYKEANGVKPQVPDPTPLEPKASPQASALMPVPGKRSVASTKGADPDDYDQAFAEAIQNLAK